jgi:hypothetical protein
VSRTQASSILVRAIVLSALLAPAARAALPEDDACTPDALVQDARSGLRTGSPALKLYLRELLKEAALVTPNDVLLRQLEREDDAAMIEALGAALAHKAEMNEDPRLIAPLVTRAMRDEDPARRAAAVRALHGTGSVELMAGAGVDVDYADLIKDEAPAVRTAVVDNLIAEDDDVYSGHSAQLAEAAFVTAEATSDKGAAARIVAETSTEGIGAERARSLGRSLDDDDVRMRVAAARALGGVPPELAHDALRALVARYRSDDAIAVRREILSSIARLERTRAIPLLESLRSVDARLDAEIDAWVLVLKLGLPEWQLVVREKNRHAK